MSEGLKGDWRWERCESWGWQYHYETWSNKHLGRMTPLACTEHWWLGWMLEGMEKKVLMNWSDNISWRRWISLVENVRQFNVKVKMSILHLNCHFQHFFFPYGLRYCGAMILSSYHELTTFHSQEWAGRVRSGTFENETYMSMSGSTLPAHPVRGTLFIILSSFLLPF